MMPITVIDSYDITATQSLLYSHHSFNYTDSDRDFSQEMMRTLC